MLRLFIYLLVCLFVYSGSAELETIENLSIYTALAHAQIPVQLCTVPHAGATEMFNCMTQLFAHNCSRLYKSYRCTTILNFSFCAIGESDLRALFSAQYQTCLGSVSPLKCYVQVFEIRYEKQHGTDCRICLQL